MATQAARTTGAQANMYSNGGQNHPFGIVNDTVLTNANLDGPSNAQHNPYLLGSTTSTSTSWA